MGNKPSSSDFSEAILTDSPSFHQQKRLSKNKSLSALTSMAKNRFSAIKNSPSTSAIRRRMPSSAKLQRSSGFSRSVTSSAINGHLLLTPSKSTPAVCESNNKNDGRRSPSVSSCSSVNDDLARASNRSLKRLAERPPTMGTNVKPTSRAASASAAAIVSAGASAEHQQVAGAAQLASALEATLTSCSSEDGSFVDVAPMSEPTSAAHNKHVIQATPTLREQHSSRSLPWSVTDSSSQLQQLSKSFILQQSSTNNHSLINNEPSTTISPQSEEMSRFSTTSFKRPISLPPAVLSRSSSTSSATSVASSPASSTITSAPDFGAAVLERMLASLTTTPSVENAPSINSSDDEAVALQPIRIQQDRPHSNKQQQVPWDTFYTTCPWSYDLNSSTASNPPTVQASSSADHSPSGAIALPESSDSASNISSCSSSEATPVTAPSAPSAPALSTNPRENTNRNSCGADSGLGGMDVAAFAHPPDTLPVVTEQHSSVEEDPSTPHLVPVSVGPTSRSGLRTSTAALRGMPHVFPSATSSTSSDRGDLDDVVSCTNDSEAVHGVGSVSESLLTHADDVNVVEHGTTTKRTGWLNVKNYMVRRRDRLELATRRRWTRYWTCLKSSVLLLYSPPDSSSDASSGQHASSTAVNAKHFIVIEEVLCQPLPEHPKRDNCFSLSTTSGDVFLLQADSLVERDAWIASIHAACALALTSQPTVPSAMRILRTEVGRLDQAVVHQRRALESKQQADGTAQSMQKAISEWESLILTSFVLRTYLASLQQAELPNPKTLLAQVSSQTKAVLRKIGAFTVSALHAIVSARGLIRSEDVQPSTYETATSEKLQLPQLSRSILHTPDSLEIANSQQSSALRVPVRLPNKAPVIFEWPPSSSLVNSLAPTTPTPKGLQPGTGVTHAKAGNVLKHLCQHVASPPLSVPDHFLMARFKGEEEWRIAERNEVFLLNVIDAMTVEPRAVVRIDLSRQSTSQAFGVEVESELDADGCQQPSDELMRVFVSRVDADARAAASGVQVGDEILVINNRLVANLDMATIEQFFEQCLNVRLTLRVARLRCALPSAVACHKDAAKATAVITSPDADYSSGHVYEKQHQQQQQQQQTSKQQAIAAEQNAPMKHKDSENRPQPPAQPAMVSAAPARKTSLTGTQKLYRAFRELIETEYAYIRDLRHLLEVYLGPLRDVVFIQDDNFAALYDAAADVYSFQCQFATSLDDAFHLLPSFHGHHQAADLLLQASDFRKPLATLSAAFRCYAAKFKLYSSFSVRHSKCLQIIQENGPSNREFQQLIVQANPSSQHSATLESFLIKPIQRILRYPLILDQLSQLSTASFANDDEKQFDPSRQLTEAGRIMAMVAEHVNELQKIFDEFGNLFDAVVTEYRQAFPSVPLILSCSSPNSSQPPRAELNIADLEMYGHVEWREQPSKPSRKGREVYSICFVFTEALVIVCKERSRKSSQTSKLYKTKSSPPQENNESDESVLYQRLLPLVDVSLRIPRPPENYLDHAPMADAQKHPFWQVVYRIPTSRVSSPTNGDLDPSSSPAEVVFTFANSSFENKQEFVTTISSLMRQQRFTDQRKINANHRRQQLARQTAAQQRSRSVGRLQHHDDANTRYDLQPVQRNASNAPPLPPRNAAVPQKPQQAADCGGSTSSGGNSDSLNSSIASINGGNYLAVPLQSSKGNQQRSSSSAKLMFLSPAGSTMSSSTCSQAAARTDLDPQSSPVWKPRGGTTSEPLPIKPPQQPQNYIKATKTGFIPQQRSRSPAERLYWHDSEVVFYRNGPEQASRNVPAAVQQKILANSRQSRAVVTTAAPMVNQQQQLQAHLQQHQQHQVMTSSASSRRSNGWFSDCECNLLLSGFDAANVV